VAFLLVFLLSVLAAPARGRVFTLASGSAQGVYLPLANDLAAVARKAGVEIHVLPSEGSKQNLAWLAEGRADLALTQSDTAWNAYSGKGGFLKPVNSLRVIAPLYTEAVHILIRRTLYIHRVEDLRGKRITVGPAGSGTEANAIQMLGAAGITLAEVDARHLSIEDAVAALRRGELDAAFVTSGVPSAVVTGVLADRTATLFEPDRDFLERLRGIFPFYLNKNIETSDYPYLPEQVTTAGVQALLVGRGDIPEATIGRLVRAIYSSPKLTGKYRLPTDGEGVSDLEIPLFKEARSYFRIQSLIHQNESFFVIAAVLLLILVLGGVYFWRRALKPRRRNAHQFLYFGIYFLSLWLTGSLLLYRVEHRINEYYSSLWRSLWSGFITIYSLSNKEPVTVEGRVIALLMFLLGLSGLLLLLEKLTLYYVEEKLIPLMRGGFARVQRMKHHYVIAGWNEKGFKIIDQLHSEDFDDHRQIVILAPEEAKDLPPQQKLVHIERGERASEANLKRVNVQGAHSVIILADAAELEADARTILTILAIRKICSEQGAKLQVPVVAEIINSRNVELAKYAGAEHEGMLEIVSSNDLGRSLLTQAAVHPGLCTVYSQLLKFEKDNSEIHSAQIPPLLIQKQRFGFNDLVRLGLNRPQGVYVMPIAIQRKGKVYVNPAQDEFRTLADRDVMFALCDSPQQLNDLLQHAADLD
jgi:TRAP transporter TAXI family solute receptor